MTPTGHCSTFSGSDKGQLRSTEQRQRLPHRHLLFHQSNRSFSPNGKLGKGTLWEEEAGTGLTMRQKTPSSGPSRASRRLKKAKLRRAHPEGQEACTGGKGRASWSRILAWVFRASPFTSIEKGVPYRAGWKEPKMWLPGV